MGLICLHKCHLQWHQRQDMENKPTHQDSNDRNIYGIQFDLSVLCRNNVEYKCKYYVLYDKLAEF